MTQAILFDWCKRSVANQYGSRVVSVSLVSRLCPKYSKMLEKSKSHSKIYFKPMCWSWIGTKKKSFESLCVCMYIFLFFLFSYMLCFSLHIHILFDFLLWLSSLGVTSISALPQLQAELKKRFSTVDIDTLGVSKAAGPLSFSKPWTT